MNENFTNARFESEDEEALWSLFRRRSGIGRKDFAEIFKRGKFHRYRRGEKIACLETLFIIIDGIVECKMLNLSAGGAMNRRKEEEGGEEESNVTDRNTCYRILLTSGQMFNLKYANVFGFNIGFFNEDFRAVALTDDTLLFGWPLEEIRNMSTSSRRAPPVVAQAWKHMLLYSIADVANRPWTRPEAMTYESVEGRRNDREEENATWTPLEAPSSLLQTRHPDFTPFSSDPDRITFSFSALLRWLWRSFNVKPPVGIRHHLVPMVQTEDEVGGGKGADVV